MKPLWVHAYARRALGALRMLWAPFCFFVLLELFNTYLLSIKRRSLSHPLTQLDNQPSLRLPMDKKADRTRRLSHVVIPFCMSQLPALKSNMELWTNASVPCTIQSLDKISLDVKLPSLVFFIAHSQGDREQDLATVQASLEDVWRTLPQFCFDGVLYHYQRLLPSSDSHILGARLMFEHMLRGNVATDMDVILYMEPDVRPIRHDWLVKCMLEVMWPQSEFWVKGAMYRGDVNLVQETDYLPSLHHINGNAFYNVGSPDFQHFYFWKLRPYIESKHGDSLNAYDTDLFEYLLDRDNYEYIRHIRHKFVYTDVILNMWHTSYSSERLIAENPNSYLVHGGTPKD